MKRRMLIPVVLLFCAGSVTAANVRSDLRESFEVGSAPARLVVKTDGADVNVTGSDSRVVDVVVEREARTSDREEAREQLQEIETSITRDGNTVYVTVRRRERAGIFNWNRQPRVDVFARVPRSTAVSVQTSGGDVEVEGTALPAVLATSGGDIELRSTRGRAEARTSGGDIEAQGHVGTLALRTSGGDIDASDISGDVSASTSGGDVRVISRGGLVNARTSGGDVHIGGAIAGGSAQTSGGDVRVDLTRSPTSAIEVSTSGSGAVVAIAPGVALDLDAHAPGERVRADVPITLRGRVEKDRIRGDVNGGGALVSVRTSGGGIRVVSLDRD